MALAFDVSGLPLLFIAGLGVGCVGWWVYEYLFDPGHHHETHSAYGAAHWAGRRDLKRMGLFGPE